MEQTEIVRIAVLTAFSLSDMDVNLALDAEDNLVIDSVVWNPELSAMNIKATWSCSETTEGIEFNSILSGNMVVYSLVVIRTSLGTGDLLKFDNRFNAFEEPVGTFDAAVLLMAEELIAVYHDVEI